MKDYRIPAGVEMSKAICAKAIEFGLEPMRRVAREFGYTLAVHGSLARDIDVVAVPWAEQAGDPLKLLVELRGAATSVFGRARLDPREDEDWNTKPHGRIARSIHCYCEGHFFYFDISVMPRSEPANP